jgi:hypothetical protein
VDGKPIATIDKSGGKPTARPLPNMEPKIVSFKRRKRARNRKR